MSKPVLFSYYRSSCAWRVRIALALKGIDYEYKAIHLIQDGGQQYSEDFSKLNPMHQVPAFVDGDNTFVQSLAIIEYINENHPEPTLLPKDSVNRAKMIVEVECGDNYRMVFRHDGDEARGLAELIASGIQPCQNLALTRKLENQDAAQWSNFWIAKGFTALEKMLSTTAGRYCVGDTLTIADCCLPPQVYNANRFNVDMTQFPIISRINEELGKLDAFIAAHPSKQPDCPDSQK